MELDLTTNALHSLMHAIEHCSYAEPIEYNDEIDDESVCDVAWIDCGGNRIFPLSEISPPPYEYNYKFAILHFAHACELILKAFIHEHEPETLFVKKGSRHTITFDKALRIVQEKHPDCLAEHDIDLMKEVKELRNDIEHYKFRSGKNKMKTSCADLAALCCYMSQRLLKINIVETFEYDYKIDEESTFIAKLSSVLTNVSEKGKRLCMKAAELWTELHPSAEVYYCIQCRAEAVYAVSNTCMGCGFEGDPELATLIEKVTAYIDRNR